MEAELSPAVVDFYWSKFQNPYLLVMNIITYDENVVKILRDKTLKKTIIYLTKTIKDNI